MKAFAATGIAHNLTVNQVMQLARMFAKMTPQGWTYPLWIDELFYYVEK